ncbi:MAG: hypothetical protein HY401_08000 [Elusimicrobia bacterium]|nr:hypothetical protein [Elusimicrobiota bacterium]
MRTTYKIGILSLGLTAGIATLALASLIREVRPFQALGPSKFLQIKGCPENLFEKEDAVKKAVTDKILEEGKTEKMNLSNFKIASFPSVEEDGSKIIHIFYSFDITRPKVINTMIGHSRFNTQCQLLWDDKTVVQPIK